MSNKLKTICIRCDEELETPMSEYQPLGGTAFESFGHYGSAVTDFCDGNTVSMITVCDDCMQDAIERGNAYVKSFMQMKLRKG